MPMFRRDDAINQARNEALSYFNFNGQRIDKVRYDLWEGNQKLLDRFYRASVVRSEAVRVIFLVPDTSLWDVYAPIYAWLAQSRRYELRVIAFQRADVVGDKSEIEIEEFFASLGIPVAIEGFGGIPCRPFDASEADLVFYTLGAVAYPDAYRIEYVSLFCRTCYLSYGFLLVDEENYQFNQDFHHSAWLVFASTEREASLYEKHRKRHTSNVRLVGYPKFDLLDSRRVALSKPTRPIVVWAPHWTVGLVYEQLKFSVFDKIYSEMCALFKERSDIDFVYKPHPNLLFAIEKAGIMSAEAYSEWLVSLSALSNVRVWKHGDYCKLFLESSAMITDSVSFLAEYLPTGNPLLYLERPDRTQMSEVGEALIALHYTGAGMPEIIRFLRDVIDEGCDPRRTKRMAVGLEMLGIDDMPVAEKVGRLIDSAFGFRMEQSSRLPELA